MFKKLLLGGSLGAGTLKLRLVTSAIVADPAASIPIRIFVPDEPVSAIDLMVLYAVEKTCAGRDQLEPDMLEVPENGQAVCNWSAPYLGNLVPTL